MYGILRKAPSTELNCSWLDCVAGEGAIEVRRQGEDERGGRGVGVCGTGCVAGVAGGPDEDGARHVLPPGDPETDLLCPYDVARGRGSFAGLDRLGEANFV